MKSRTAGSSRFHQFRFTRYPATAQETGRSEICVETSGQRAAAPEPEPVMAQSTTPRSKAEYTSGKPMLTGCAPRVVKKSTSELPKVRMRRPRKSFRLVKGARQNTTCAGKGYIATSRAPKRSRSRLATGNTASAMRRASLMSGASPAKSMPSKMGTSPDRVVRVPAPISTWPERTRRTISLPARLRSAWVES